MFHLENYQIFNFHFVSYKKLSKKIFFFTLFSFIVISKEKILGASFELTDNFKKKQKLTFFLALCTNESKLLPIALSNCYCFMDWYAYHSYNYYYYQYFSNTSKLIVLFISL